jgi:Glycosyl hydrolase family 12
MPRLRTVHSCRPFSLLMAILLASLLSLTATSQSQTLITSDSLLNSGSPLSATYTAGGAQATSVVKLATNSADALWMFYPDASGGGSGTIVQNYTGSGSFSETINLSGLPASGVDGYPFLLYGCDNYSDCWNGQGPQFPKQLSSMSSLIVDISYALTGTITGSRNVDMLFDEWVCNTNQPSAQSNCLEVMVLPYYSFPAGTGQPLVKTFNQSVIINGSPATFSWDEWDGHPGQNMLFTPHTRPGPASQELRFDMLTLMKTATTDYGNSSFSWLMGVEPGTEFGGSRSQSYQLTISKLDIEQTLGSLPAPPTNLTVVVN